MIITFSTSAQEPLNQCTQNLGQIILSDGGIHFSSTEGQQVSLKGDNNRGW
jgi:hypothetical protein